MDCSSRVPLLERSKSGSSEDAFELGESFEVGQYKLSSCPICLERFTVGNPAIIVCCRHGFHLQCLESWRQRSSQCPVCWRKLHRKGEHIMSAAETHPRGGKGPLPGEGSSLVGPSEEEMDDPRTVDSFCTRLCRCFCLTESWSEEDLE